MSPSAILDDLDAAPHGVASISNASPVDKIPFEDYPRLYGWPTTNDDGYTINEAPSGVHRPLRIVVMGAGASGINFAKWAETELKNVTFQLYEKNHDVAGTWLENRYPGCACDVPSVTYQFTWKPHIWSKYYSESPEIFDYFKGIVEEYRLDRYIKLNHAVRHAEWDQELGKWKIRVEDTVKGEEFVDECDIFINGGGPLNYWEWPNIQGIKSFKGTMVHSAAYPEGLDLSGKKVAVVGIGSSGMQITATISKQVSHLYTWIRSPTWVLGSFAAKYLKGESPNPAYTPEEKKVFREDPVTYLKYRKNVEANINQGFPAFYQNTPEALAAKKVATAMMQEKLVGHPRIADALIPKNFPVGCKRPTPGNGFLEALIADNATVFTEGGLNQITEKGFLDPDGKEVEVDVIILATGFNTTWVPRFPIVAHGRNLQDMYRKNPLSYLGLAAPSMPNYFTYYGPYGPLGQASALVMIESFTKYFFAMINKIQLENIKSVAPRPDVALQFQSHADLYLRRTVWATGCRSWWKGGTENGRIMLYPGSRNQYMKLINNPRYEDYDYEYHGQNMWHWLGNGFDALDVDGRDITWYMGLVDGEDVQREYKVEI